MLSQFDDVFFMKYYQDYIISNSLNDCVLHNLTETEGYIKTIYYLL